MKKPAIAFLTLSLLASQGSAWAANSYTWTGGGDGATWDIGTNWGQVATTYPGSGTGDTGSFTSNATLTALGKNLSIASVGLNGGGDTVSITDGTNTLSLSSNATSGAISDAAGTLNLDTNLAFATGTQYINATGNITIGGATAVTLNATNAAIHFSGTGTTTLGSNVTLTSAASGTKPQLHVDAGATLAIAAVPTIGSGTGFGGTRLWNVDGGTLQIAVAMTTTTSNQVFLSANGSSVILTANHAEDTGIMQFAAPTSGTNTYTLGISASGAATGTFSTGGNWNSGAGNVVMQLSATNSTNTLVVSGANSGANLQVNKIGAGTVILSGANTFTGTTTVSSGTLQVTNTALQDTTLSTGGGGTITLTSANTTPVIGGLSGSQNLGSQFASSSYSTITSLTVQPQSGVSDTYSGSIANGAAGMTVTIGGTGTQTFSGASTYTGGTTVNSGASFFINNNPAGNASATGSGALTVQAGAVFGGTGAAVATGNSSTTFALGASTGTPATVYVGQSSAADANTTSALTLKGSSTVASTIQNANLVFNLDSTTANAGNELSVGNTKIAFNTTPNVANVTLTMNLEGANVIAPGTTYVLIAGTGGGAGLGQYSGFTVDANNVISGLSLAFTGSQPPSWYANSYLVLVNNGSNIDDIDVVVVPEPGTWAMMLGGLVLLVFVQRRRLARMGESKGRKASA